MVFLLMVIVLLFFFKVVCLWELFNLGEMSVSLLFVNCVYCKSFFLVGMFMFVFWIDGMVFWLLSIFFFKDMKYSLLVIVEEIIVLWFVFCMGGFLVVVFFFLVELSCCVEFFMFLVGFVLCFFVFVIWNSVCCIVFFSEVGGMGVCFVGWYWMFIGLVGLFLLVFSNFF